MLSPKSWLLFSFVPGLVVASRTPFELLSLSTSWNMYPALADGPSHSLKDLCSDHPFYKFIDIYEVHSFRTLLGMIGFDLSGYHTAIYPGTLQRASSFPTVHMPGLASEIAYCQERSAKVLLTVCNKDPSAVFKSPADAVSAAERIFDGFFKKTGVMPLGPAQFDGINLVIRDQPKWYREFVLRLRQLSVGHGIPMIIHLTVGLAFPDNMTGPAHPKTFLKEGGASDVDALRVYIPGNPEGIYNNHLLIPALQKWQNWVGSAGNKLPLLIQLPATDQVAPPGFHIPIEEIAKDHFFESLRSQVPAVTGVVLDDYNYGKRNEHVVNGSSIDYNLHFYRLLNSENGEIGDIDNSEGSVSAKESLPPTELEPVDMPNSASWPHSFLFLPAVASIFFLC